MASFQTGTSSFHVPKCLRHFLYTCWLATKYTQNHCFFSRWMTRASIYNMLFSDGYIHILITFWLAVLPILFSLFYSLSVHYVSIDDSESSVRNLSRTYWFRCQQPTDDCARAQPVSKQPCMAYSKIRIRRGKKIAGNSFQEAPSQLVEKQKACMIALENPRPVLETVIFDTPLC